MKKTFRVDILLTTILVFAVLSPSNAWDTEPPWILTYSVSNGEIVSGTKAVSASATDNTGVTKVEIYIDGALVKTFTAGPYDYSWNTTAYSNGQHTIVSKAYDGAGNVGTAASVTVTVSN